MGKWQAGVGSGAGNGSCWFPRYQKTVNVTSDNTTNRGAMILDVAIMGQALGKARDLELRYFIATNFQIGRYCYAYNTDEKNWGSLSQNFIPDIFASKSPCFFHHATLPRDYFQPLYSLSYYDLKDESLFRPCGLPPSIQPPRSCDRWLCPKASWQVATKSMWKPDRQDGSRQQQKAGCWQAVWSLVSYFLSLWLAHVSFMQVSAMCYFSSFSLSCLFLLFLLLKTSVPLLCA